MTAELEESDRPVVLDHDTKGVAGSPAITETIERKIRECDVFVADLTPVTVLELPDGKIRFLPNPNVMYELGYAFGSIDSQRIFGVLNTAFAGPARDKEHLLKDGVLPFNLRHRRHPCCYELPEKAKTTDLRKERTLLANELTESIRLVIDTIHQTDVPSYEPHQPLVGRVSTFIRHQELILKGGFPTNWQDESAQVYARFLPDRELDLTPFALEQACTGDLRHMPPFSTTSGDFGLNQYGFAACGTTARNGDIVTSKDIIQYFHTGEIWAILGTFLRRDSEYVAWIVEDFFAWFALQVANYLSAIKYSGSGRMVFGLTGINGRGFASPRTAVSNSPSFQRDDFLFDQPIENASRGELGITAEAAASRLWEEVAMKRPPDTILQKG